MEAIMKLTEGKSWNPYLAGALSGLVSIFSVWIAGKFIGVSTTFVRTTGMIEKIFSAERVAAMDYFIKETPIIDWQWMFVIGIFIGSLISATTSGDFQLKAIPDMWEKRFGSCKIKRGATAFAGGAIGMFGARLADG
jgi:hypothetical protein